MPRPDPLRTWILCCVAAVVALPMPAYAQWYPTRHFSVREGLVQSQVTGVTQDAYGYLWFATWGGVSRYDGRRFMNLSVRDGLPDSLVSAVAADAHGSVWFGTDAGGLARWDGRALRSVPGPEPAEHLAVTALSCLPDGSLLVGTEAGLWHLAAGSYTRLHDERITMMVTGSSLWVLAADGVFRMASGRLVPVSLPSELIDRRITALTADGDHLWMSTTQGALIDLSPDGSFAAFATPVTRPQVLLADPRSEGLWLGSREGLWLFDGAGTTSPYALRPNTQAAEVRALATDHEGSLWIGTWGEGVYQHVTGTFEVFTQDTGLPSSMVWGLVEDRAGCVWMATSEAGVRSWCHGAWGPSITKADGLPSDSTLSIHLTPDGSLWIGTRDGLCQRHKDGSLRVWNVLNGLPDNYVRVVSSDPAGRVWVGTNRGIARFDGRHWTAWTEADGFPDDVIRGMDFDASGQLWVATHSAGVVRFDGKRFHSITTAEGLPHDRVWCLMVDSHNRVVAGTDAGVWIHPLSGGDGDTVVDTSDGLLNANILALAEDHEGFLWVGSTHGVARLTPDGKVARVFTADDGLSDSEGAENATLVDRSGRVWLGMADGITCIDPEMLPHNPHPPRLVLDRLIVNGQPWGAPFPLSSAVPVAEPRLELGPATTDLRFEFAALSFRSPEKVRYRFMLEGLDTREVAPTEDNHVVYRRPPPGDYRFHIDACNDDGVWSPSPLAVSFTIRPPWYRTTAFQLLAGLLAAGLVLGWLRARMAVQRRREGELETQVSLRTTELAEANQRIVEQNHLLEELSRRDPLTGLMNRRALAEQLPVEMAVLKREVVRPRSDASPPFNGAAVFLLDLDFFKEVNDRHGHETGDRVLRQLADRISALLREVDLAVRWGGDELLVLARGLDATGMQQLAARLMNAVAATPFASDGRGRIHLTTSVGFVPYPLGQRSFLDRDQWQQLVELADRALYVAKARGRARACGIVWQDDIPPSLSEAAILQAVLDDPEHPPAGLTFAEVTLPVDHDETPGLSS